MDIGLLYQEYQRSAAGQQQQQQQQQQPPPQPQMPHLPQLQQPQQKQRLHQHAFYGQRSLIRSISRAMPQLLSPGSPSSRLSTNIPLSGSSTTPVEWSDFRCRARQLEQQHHSKSSLASTRVSITDRKTLSDPPVAATSSEASAAAVVRPRCLPEVERQQPQQHRTYPLVAIDPKDVKRVLSQMVTEAMRDLLGKHQDARDTGLLRHIKRTLGQFEASLSAIVNSFVAARHQAGCQQHGVANNSAGNFALGTDTGVGVCVGGADNRTGAGPSPDSGQSIRESCCCCHRCSRCCSDEDRQSHSSDGETRVALLDSDADFGTPHQYRSMSSPRYPSRTTSVTGAADTARRSRYQKNYNQCNRRCNQGNLYDLANGSDGCSSSNSSSVAESSCWEQVLSSLSTAASAGHLECPIGNQFPRFTAARRCTYDFN